MGKINIKWLLVILITLVLADILTRFFFWKELDLVFDASNFNNIVTPIATVLAFCVYYTTLKNLIKQTKIIKSQSMKPFFETRLKDLKLKAASVLIEYKGSDEVKKYDALNYINGLSKLYNLLVYDIDFNNDIIRTHENITTEYIESRSYYNRFSIIFDIINDKNPLYKYYLNVEQFFYDVETSTMTDEDKALFKKEVIEILLKDYIEFIKALDLDNIYNPLIPLLYTTDSDSVEFKQLNQTKFRDCYDNIIGKKTMWRKGVGKTIPKCSQQNVL